MPQISPITLVAPGSLGLNKEQEQSLLDPRWATAATNCVLDRNGRLAVRKGWADQTTNPVAGNATIDVLHEYVQTDGDTFIITAAANKMFKDIDDYTDAGNDITSSTAPSADHWQFVNYNNRVIGIQSGEILVEWAGTGDFTDITASGGTLPAGSCGTAAFGRLWIVDSDGQTIKYCALLDQADWDTTGDAGTIDMEQVWTNGTDRVKAIAALGSSLVVFGDNHIIIWEDGTGSDIGIDPTQIQVVQTIEGTGCIARDSVQAIGEGDLLFLSRHGVQSLGQLLQVRDRPLSNLTKNYRTDITTAIAAETLRTVRSAYNPERGLYMLSFPSSNKVVVLDTRRFFVDEEGDRLARVTEWTFETHPTALLSRENGDVLFGFDGMVGKYGGNLDDTSRYSVDFWTGWLDLGQQAENRLKILKEIAALVSISASGTVTYKWEFDFSGVISSRTVEYTTGDAAEYGTAKYNEDFYSGGTAPVRRLIDAAGEGQFVRVGFTTSVNSFDLALQQLQMYPKLGRMA